MGFVCANAHPNIVQFIGWVEEPRGIVMKKYLGTMKDVIRDMQSFPVLTIQQLAFWSL